jgi:hypothetical protein
MSIAVTHARILEADQAERGRTADEREWQRVDRAITRALDVVELVALAGGTDCPPAVAKLIEYLCLLADEPVVGPATALEAHEVLFHLSAVLLGFPEHEGETGAAA